MRRLLRSGISRLIVTVLLSTACSARELSDAEIFSHNLDAKFSQLAENKYQLVTTGIGGSIYGKIRNTSLHFAYYGKMTSEEARDLMVHLTNDFIEIVKSNKDSEKYVEYKPSLLTFFNMSIRFDTEETSCQHKGFFMLSNHRGQFSYSVYDPDDPTGWRSSSFLKETFQQAEQIVAEEDLLNAEIGANKCAI